MARDLEMLRDKLWKIFDEVHADHAGRSNYAYNGVVEKLESAKAIASLGQAIAGVEGEIRSREEDARRFPSPINKKPAA